MDKQGLLKKIKADSLKHEECAADFMAKAEMKQEDAKALWDFAEFLKQHPDGETAWAKYRCDNKLDLVNSLPTLDTLCTQRRSKAQTLREQYPSQREGGRPSVAVPEGMFTFGGELPTDLEKARDALIEEMFPWSVVEAALLESVSP